MERNEFGVWVMALQTYYERFNLLRTPQAIELWYRELNYIPADVLTAALRKWVNIPDKGQFPPSIAELKTLVNEVVSGPLPDWGSGWAEVRKAIGRWGIMQREQALESMSETTRKTVERIGWDSICMSENADVIRAQFRQVYEIMARREAEDRNLSPELKAVIQHIQLGAGYMPELTGGKNQ